MYTNQWIVESNFNTENHNKETRTLTVLEDGVELYTKVFEIDHNTIDKKATFGADYIKPGLVHTTWFNNGVFRGEDKFFYNPKTGLHSRA